MISLALIGFCVVAETALELCFKTASNRAAEIDGSLLSAVKQPIAWLGITLWLIEALIWVKVLQITPLHVAYPLMSLTYVGIPVTSHILLKEKIGIRHLMATIFIASGVVLLAAFPS